MVKKNILHIDNGIEISNNLRKIIEEEEFERVVHITCSFGNSQYREGGRNRVCKGL